MLYITTREDRDAFTAHRALYESRGRDGGLYLPFRAPSLSRPELEKLLDCSFHDCVAQMLNLLFNTKLTAWEVECAIGRQPFYLAELGHRVTLVETWRNLSWHYDHTVRQLSALLRPGNAEPAGNWLRIAIRISILFGIFAGLHQAGFDKAVDISVVTGDFSAPMSVWYAKQWGLPIGNIICCCNENNGLWDFFCHGQLRTDSVSTKTITPDGDITVPEDLERLIYASGGTAEVARYLEVCRRGRMYSIDGDMLNRLRKDMYVSVVSSQRVLSTIPSVYRIQGCLLSPYDALAYAGSTDYRARTGATRHCLVLSEKSPIYDADVVAEAMGIQPGDVKNYL